jgi:hypothetical protein
VYLCPCGEIMIPSNYASGVPAGSERDLFVQSLKLAIARRNSTTLDQIAQGTVSLAEHNRLKAQFEELATALQCLGGRRGDARTCRPG